MNKKQIRQIFLVISSLCVITIFYFLFFQQSEENKVEDKDSPAYLIKPFFRGIAENNTLYEVNAENAFQVGDQLYDLKSVHLKFYLDPEKISFITVDSLKGEMNDKTRIFDFVNNVEINYSIGYRGKTDILSVNFNTMIISTNTKFMMSGIKGKISSENGMKYHIRTKEMKFNGPVKTFFVNRKL